MLERIESNGVKAIIVETANRFASDLMVQITLRAIVEEHRQREGILKNTLLTAQRLSEDLKDNARKQGETVVKEAELQADRLLEMAQNRAHEVERGILDLRTHRTGLRTDIRAFINRLTHLLDLQEEAELDDNLRFLKRREEAQ